MKNDHIEDYEKQTQKQLLYSKFNTNQHLEQHNIKQSHFKLLQNLAYEKEQEKDKNIESYYYYLSWIKMHDRSYNYTENLKNEQEAHISYQDMKIQNLNNNCSKPDFSQTPQTEKVVEKNDTNEKIKCQQKTSKISRKSHFRTKQQKKSRITKTMEEENFDSQITNQQQSKSDKEDQYNISMAFIQGLNKQLDLYYFLDKYKSINQMFENANFRKEDFLKQINQEQDMNPFQIQKKTSKCQQGETKSQFHNKNKLYFNSIIRSFVPALFDQICMPPQLQNIVWQAIEKCKNTGIKYRQRKKISKTDQFNHSHYRTLFLNLNKNSFSQIKHYHQDIKLHKIVFGINLNEYNSIEDIDEEKLGLINFQKYSIYILYKKYIEQRLMNILIQKNQFVYEERACKGIELMSQGVTITRF